MEHKYNTLTKATSTTAQKQRARHCTKRNARRAVTHAQTTVLLTRGTLLSHSRGSGSKPKWQIINCHL